MPPPSVSRPPEPKAARTSPDIFAEFALSEEQTAPVSPIRRRRPSEGGPPRSKTTRELTKEIDTLKDNLMTSNMRVELLKKNNTDLQYKVTELKEQVEELEPLEEENSELRDENNHYKLKMQAMEDELAQLRDENDSLRKSHEEMLAINDECSTHWEDQELAVQEAADTIIALETEKAALAAEVQKLKERVTALEDDSSHTSTLVDGSQRCPSRVYSIDEARPSTSHFDSDYFSQPDSPQVKNSRDSIISIAPSERSRKFLDSTQERRQSARDLAKRMSVASLKALAAISSPSPAPAVPQVPIRYQLQIPRIVEEVSSERRPSRTPRRHRERQLPQQTLQDALDLSPDLTPTSSEAAARSPTREAQDRHQYRPKQSINTRSSNDSHHSSNQATTPTTSQPRSRQQSSAETSPYVPSRMSSKHAPTSSSNEQLSLPHRDNLTQRDFPSHRDLRNPRQRPRPNMPQAGQEEWALHAPTAHSSPLSISDLTSEVDHSDRDRWWKSVDGITPVATQPPQLQPQPQPQVQPAIIFSNSSSARPRYSPAKHDGAGFPPRTQPGYDLGRALFDGSEDVDAFIRRTRM
jgi:myosin heavy subunit